MSEQPKKTIFDGSEYLYAEQLKGKHVSLTIKFIRPKEIIGDGGRKSQGFEIGFEETPKKFAFSGATVRRQLAMALGTDVVEEMLGKKVTLYPVESRNSISGQAIRVKV